MTSTSGWASLIARVASWTAPSSSQAPEPSSSLCGGDAEEQDGGDAERVGLAGLGDGARDREPVDAGHGADRSAAVEALLDEERQDEVAGIQPRLAHEVAQHRRGAQAAQARLREGHAYIVGATDPPSDPTAPMASQSSTVRA